MPNNNKIIHISDYLARKSVQHAVPPLKNPFEDAVFSPYGIFRVNKNNELERLNGQGEVIAREENHGFIPL